MVSGPHRDRAVPPACLGFQPQGSFAEPAALRLWPRRQFAGCAACSFFRSVAWTHLGAGLCQLMVFAKKNGPVFFAIPSIQVLFYYLEGLGMMRTFHATRCSFR